MMPLSVGEIAAVQNQVRQVGADKAMSLVRGDAAMTPESIIAVAQMPELGHETRLSLVREAYRRRVEPARERFLAALGGET